MVGLYQDVPLGPDVGQLLLGHHVRLSQDLHGVDVTCVNLLYQPHLKKKDQTLVVIINNFAKSVFFCGFLGILATFHGVEVTCVFVPASPLVVIITSNNQ